MAKIKFHLLPILLLCLCAVAAYHVWFFNLSPITYGDWFVDYLEKIKEFLSLPSLWAADANFGTVNIGNFFWPFLFFSGILAQFNLNAYLIERIIFLYPIAILTPIFMYALSYYIFKSRLTAFVSAIVYSFNLYLIILSAGHLTLRMGITLIPLLLLFFLKALNEKKLIYSIIAALISFAISFYEFRIFYLVVWLLGFYTLYHLFFLKKAKSLKNTIHLIFLSSIVVIIPILLNFYSLLGTAMTGTLTSNIATKVPLFGSWYIKLSKIMTIFQYDWTGGKPTGFIPQPIHSHFFLLPIMAFSGFLVHKKKSTTTFFVFLAAIGIFLAKQSIVPFPDFYQWLFDHLPGFNAFRESGKFMAYVALSYAILIGAFIDWLWQVAKTKKTQIIAALTTVFTVLIFLWNSKPLITGELGTLFIQRSVPHDYLLLKDFILGQNDYFRTFWVPTRSRWSPYSVIHPFVIAQSIYETEWKKYADFQNNPKKASSLERLFDHASIKYVVIPLEDNQNDDNFFKLIGLKREEVIRDINRLSFLKRIDIGMSSIVIFENPDFRPHIYATTQKETITNWADYQRIFFSSNNPTEYKFGLKHVDKPIYVNFTEAYHPDWKLYIGKLNYLDIPLKRDIFLPDRLHSKSDVGLNSYLINPEFIKQNLSKDLYKINADGSLDLDLTIYFRPQSYVYFGLIISGITFLLLILYLIFFLLKKVMAKILL